MSASDGPALRRLAQLWGVQMAYKDVQGQRRSAGRDSLLAALKALGAPLAGPSDIRDALRETQALLARRVLEPVTIAWQGGPAPELQMRLPRRQASGVAHCRLRLEDGQERLWDLRLEELGCAASQSCAEEAVTVRVPLPGGLPVGYHWLTVVVRGESHESLVLSAPRRAFDPGGRRWGVFLPLYALRSEADWGVGDFGGLRTFAEWVRQAGGDLVALLPLLPSFLDEPLEPSPYAPVSRLFWNELYVDVGAVPELAACAAARGLVASPAFEAEVSALRDLPFVDYRRVMSVKRRVLEELARWFFASGHGPRRDAHEAFLARRPDVREYARFRAACETWRLPWRLWPERARRRCLEDADVDVASERYHLYVQWICHDQLMAAARNQRGGTARLLLDLPLGVHPDGYDTWRYDDAFARGVSAGAPPDTFFTRGQNWGFPPLHPHGIRRQGYRYWRAALRHHLSVAAALRIDHVMALHRLYWIPNGMDAREGVYVRYPSEEMYAVLCIESLRQRALIVGEDLGTVPRAVTRAMARHGVHRTYVLQYEASPQAVPDPPEPSVASLNTHDMAPFRAFWEGLDILDQEALALHTPGGASELRKKRASVRRALLARLRQGGWLATGSGEGREVTVACLRMLAGSKARTVLVNLEDLWGETAPQNVPGTRDERPNWRRRARHRVEDVARMEDVGSALGEVRRLREAGGNGP